LITYLISNIYVKHYQNRFVYVRGVAKQRSHIFEAKCTVHHNVLIIFRYSAITKICEVLANHFYFFGRKNGRNPTQFMKKPNPPSLGGKWTKLCCTVGLRVLLLLNDVLFSARITAMRIFLNVKLMICRPCRQRNRLQSHGSML